MSMSQLAAAGRDSLSPVLQQMSEAAFICLDACEQLTWPLHALSKCAADMTSLDDKHFTICTCLLTTCQMSCCCCAIPDVGFCRTSHVFQSSPFMKCAAPSRKVLAVLQAMVMTASLMMHWQVRLWIRNISTAEEQTWQLLTVFLSLAQTGLRRHQCQSCSMDKLKLMWL